MVDQIARVAAPEDDAAALEVMGDEAIDQSLIVVDAPITAAALRNPSMRFATT